MRQRQLAISMSFFRPSLTLNGGKASPSRKTSMSLTGHYYEPFSKGKNKQRACFLERLWNVYFRHLTSTATRHPRKGMLVDD
jgi:hypothetical protein